MTVKQKRPLPRKYWQMIGVIAFLFIIVFFMLFVVLYLTENREMRDFTGEDWLYWATFVCVAAVFLFISFLVAKEAGVTRMEHDHLLFRSILHQGISPADYAGILPDWEGDRRALITRTEYGYQLTIDQYDEQSGIWQCDGEMPLHFPDRMALLQYLEEECDFTVDPEDLDLFPAETE